MSKRSTWTSITPLPTSISRTAAISFLHDHLQMIDMNPLVKERHPIPAPSHAEPGEEHCVWYSITDSISYLPGDLWKRDLSYTAAFHDIPDGLQTHVHAPLGVEIRDRWSVGGSLPGEPHQPVELGIGAPTTGLYLREDVDLKCNFIMSGFVKKTLKDSHMQLVNKLKDLAAAGASTSQPLPTAASNQGHERHASSGVSMDGRQRLPPQELGQPDQDQQLPPSHRPELE